MFITFFLISNLVFLFTFFVYDIDIAVRVVVGSTDICAAAAAVSSGFGKLL